MLRNFLRPAIMLAYVFVRQIASTALRHRQLGLFMLVAFVCFPLSGLAQTRTQYIHVLLSNAPGAPTPSQVVNYYNFSPRAPGGPPLQGLMVENPQQTYFLMPTRASGDFLTYLQANPDSVRAKLERYVIVSYLPSASLSNALSALRSDPNVEAAFPAVSAKFSSVQLLGFTVGQPALAPLTSGTQYGRDDLNVDAAWQLAGGYALIGDVDSGLYVNHPALRQFSSTGQYLGGNYVPAASLNIGNIPTSIDADIDEETPLPLASNSVCNPSHLPAVAPLYVTLPLNFVPHSRGHVRACLSGSACQCFSNCIGLT